MESFTLIYRPFPPDCGGDVHGIISGAGERAMIIIDSAQDEQTQQRALRHELAHLALNHLSDFERTVEQLEAEADDYAERMSESEFEELMRGAVYNG